MQYLKLYFFCKIRISNVLSWQGMIFWRARLSVGSWPHACSYCYMDSLPLLVLYRQKNSFAKLCDVWL